MDKMNVYQRAIVVFPQPIGPQDTNRFRGHLAKALDVDVNIISTIEGISRPFSHPDEEEGDCTAFSFKGIIIPKAPVSIKKYGPMGTNFESFQDSRDAYFDRVYRFRFWVTPGCEEEYNSPSRLPELRLWEDVRNIASQFQPLRTG